MLEDPGSAERLRKLRRAAVSQRDERAKKLAHLYIFALVAIGTFALGWALTMSPLGAHLTFRELAEGLLTAIR